MRLWLVARLHAGELHHTLWQAAVVGLAGGLAIVAFRWIIAALERLQYGHAEGLVAAAASLPGWLRVLVPTVGGILAGLVLQYAKRIKTDVASDYMEAISLRDGAISARLSLTRSLSSMLSIVSGGSIGREGSMVQLASLSGFVFARWQELAPPRRRLLVACGGAAGIAAAYNAPIAGALFIAEIVLRTISIESLGPLVAASVIATLTAHSFFGGGSVYDVPAMPPTAGGDIWLHGVLGVLAGLLAPCFLALLDFSREAFNRLPAALPLRLGIGGLLVGTMSLAYPEVWGNGYSVVNGILAGHWLWQALLIVLVFKLAATAVTIGSGAIGGVFTPTLFAGAALGCLFGYAMEACFPALGGTTAFVVTGMAAFLAATIHAPLTATVIVVEMTGDLQRLPPAMLAVVLAVAISRLLRERSVYGDSLKPVANHDFVRMNVGDVLRHDPPTVRSDGPLSAFEKAYVDSRWQHVYAIDADGRFQGAVSIHELGPLLHETGSSNRVAKLPPGLLRSDYPRLHLEQRLSDALATFASHTGERLPVLDAADKLVGYASKTDLMLLLREGLAAD